MSDTPIVDRAERWTHELGEVVEIETARQLERMCNDFAEALRRCEADAFPHKATGYAKAALARWQAMKEQK